MRIDVHPTRPTARQLTVPTDSGAMPRSRAFAFAVWIVVGSFVAACGGSSARTNGVATREPVVATVAPGAGPSSSPIAVPSPGASTPGPSAGPVDPADAMLAYSRCMRDHGVANFPDPVNGGLAIDGNEVGIDTPVYKAAEEACRSLVPPPPVQDPERMQQEREQMLAYAQCMRDHGVPNFPDPEPGGGINIGPEVGVDPGSPAFTTAEEACNSLPGAPGGPGSVSNSTGGPGGSQSEP